MKESWHRKNDIVLALIIIIAAAAVIVWRFNIIMDYPSKLASQAARQEKTAQQDVSEKESAIETGTAFKKGKLASDTTVTIGDTGDQAAVQDLLNKHLFDSYDQFTSDLDKVGGSMDKLKTGTLNFKKGTSAETFLRSLTAASE